MDLPNLASVIFMTQHTYSKPYPIYCRLNITFYQ